MVQTDGLTHACTHARTHARTHRPDSKIPHSKESKWNKYKFDDLLTMINLITEILSNPHYGVEFRDKRKFAVRALRSFGTNKDTADANILAEVTKLLAAFRSYREKPVDISQDIINCTAAIISSIFFHKDFSHDDPDLTELVTLAKDWYASCNVFIVLQTPIPLPYWAHIRYFCKEFDDLMAKTDQLSNYILKEVNSHRESYDPENPRDVIDAYLIHQKGENLGTTFAATLLSFFPDSIDTMAVFMRWIMLYVTLYPEVQRKIQTEIDDVVGSGRMVCFSLSEYEKFNILT